MLLRGPQKLITWNRVAWFVETNYAGIFGIGRNRSNLFRKRQVIWLTNSSYNEIKFYSNQTLMVNYLSMCTMPIELGDFFHTISSFPRQIPWDLNEVYFTSFGKFDSLKEFIWKYYTRKRNTRTHGKYHFDCVN